MVGNDIIDLELTRQQSNWRRKGFAQKVFTSEEQKMICTSGDSFMTAWRLWSMKESAYKMFLQTGNERFFNPLYLKCEITSPEKGVVICQECRMCTRSRSNSKFIFTSASATFKDFAEDQIFILPKGDCHFQSDFIHRQTLKYMARKFGLNINKLQLRKTNQNVPEVFYDKDKIDLSISLTHHGIYGAISCIWP